MPNSNKSRTFRSLVALFALCVVAIFIYDCATSRTASAPSINIAATVPTDTTSEDKKGLDDTKPSDNWPKWQAEQKIEYQNERQKLLPYLSSQKFLQQKRAISSLLHDSDEIQTRAERQLLEEAQQAEITKSSKTEFMIEGAYLEQLLTSSYIGQTAMVLDRLSSTSRKQFRESIADWLGKIDATLGRVSPTLNAYAANERAIRYCGIDPNLIQISVSRSVDLSSNAKKLYAEDSDITSAWIEAIHSNMLAEDAEDRLTCLKEWRDSGQPNQPGQP
jgi:hypothetical protein